MRGTILLAIGTGIANIAALIFFSRKLSRVMSAQDRLNQVIQGLNQATNEIAARLHEALQQLKDGQVTPESLGTLETAVQQLRSMGQSTSDPLPGTIPVGHEIGNTGSQAGTGIGAGNGDQNSGTGQLGTGATGDGGTPGTDTAGAPIPNEGNIGTGDLGQGAGTNEAGTGGAGTEGAGPGEG